MLYRKLTAYKILPPGITSLYISPPRQLFSQIISPSPPHQLQTHTNTFSSSYRKPSSELITPSLSLPVWEVGVLKTLDLPPPPGRNPEFDEALPSVPLPQQVWGKVPLPVPRWMELEALPPPLLFCEPPQSHPLSSLSVPSPHVCSLRSGIVSCLYS